MKITVDNIILVLNIYDTNFALLETKQHDQSHFLVRNLPFEALK
jgi:hypothetical protein